MTTIPSLPHTLVAYLKKDLRQNLLTVPLLLGIAAIIVTIATYFQLQFYYGFTSLRTGINILFLPVTQMAVAGGLAAVGFLLGTVQIRGDNSLDLWAFLVHRPAHRSHLFLGRLLAGTVLYLAVAGIPLAVLLYYTTTSSAGEFFHWQFALPSLADFFSGYIYYLAGLLVAQSNATLVGPRVIPLIAALLCSFLIRTVDSFAIACLIIAAFAIPLILAALGSFQSHGFRLKAPPLQHAARILLAWLGIAALLAIPYGYFHTTLNRVENQQFENLTREQDHFQPRPERTLSRRFLLPDGTIATRITHIPAVTSPASATEAHENVISYATLDGTPLPDLTRESAEPDKPLTSPVQETLATPTIDASSYRDIASSVAEINTGHFDPASKLVSPESWFYLQPERRFYIYQPKPRTFLGTFGQNGFAPPGQHSQPFDAPADPYGPFVTPHALLQINMETRTVTTLFMPPPGETLLQILRVNDYSSALATDKHIFLFGQPQINSTHRGYNPSASLPLAHPFDSYQTHFYYLPQSHRFALWYTKLSPNPVFLTGSPALVQVFNSAGNLLHENTLDWTLRWQPAISYTASPEELAIVHHWQFNTGLLDGAFCPLLTQILPRVPQIDYTGTTHSASIYLAFVVATAVLSALLMFLLLRRYNHTLLRSLPWLVAALLLGLPALLTFLATHAYPRRLPCPSCQKPRPLNQNLCPRCHSPWPLPQATGTEILTA